MAATGTTDFSLKLTFDTRAAGVARAFVAEHSHVLPTGLVEDAKLLVSELVTNAVRHGRPDVTLRVSLQSLLIEISVQDEGPAGLSADIHPLDLKSPGGRGLRIVDLMSSTWGVITTDPSPGKTVWFRLDTPAA